MNELEQFPGDAERQAALSEIAKESANLKSGYYWLAVGILVGSLLAVRALVKWGLNRVVWNFWVEEFILWSALLGSAWFVLRKLHRWGAPEQLREKLLAAGAPVCMKCGYSLRGLPADREHCPECGAEFDPRARVILSRNAETPRTETPK